MNPKVVVHEEQIAKFCQERNVKRFAFFGSALCPDFNSTSDIDVLVEFEAEHTPGFFGIARMEREP